jgi:hypothetical protein
MVTFVHYPTAEGARSGTGERFLDNVVIEGPIPVIVRDALAAIRRNMSRRAVISGAGRQDIWEYPETALREAVVNALVHRDRIRPSGLAPPHPRPADRARPPRRGNGATAVLQRRRVHHRTQG